MQSIISLGLPEIVLGMYSLATIDFYDAFVNTLYNGCYYCLASLRAERNIQLKNGTTHVVLPMFLV